MIPKSAIEEKLLQLRQSYQEMQRTGSLTSRDEAREQYQVCMQWFREQGLIVELKHGRWKVKQAKVENPLPIRHP